MTRSRPTFIVVLAGLILLSQAFLTAAETASSDPGWWREGPRSDGGEHPVRRSPADDRGYRYLTLDNGLAVLLISDPDTDKAAASMNVQVGSFDNPRDREGLAHFLEHMLFLGTDKYPEAGAYQKFISEHGGQHNAYTSMENTNYFFDVEAGHLLAALNRFSRFFVAPRFDAQYVDRERNAVESEFRLKFKDDSRREWEVFSEQVDPAHPLSQFSVGNLETLADREGRPVRTELVRFYERYYRAQRMSLVVLGSQTLGQLEVVVRGLFQDIPAAKGKGDTWSRVASDAPSVPTFQRALPLQLEIKPVKDVRSLSMVFPLPSFKAKWRTRPDHYWGHLIGDETDGSLIARLKKAGLANGLSAGQGFDTDRGAAFIVKIELTPQGVEHSDEVLRQFFAWLNLARQQGLQAWRFVELAELLQTRFRFQEQVPPASYVQFLSARLRDYPPEEVLRGPYLLDQFDEGLLDYYAGFLVPDNAFVSLMAPEVGETDRVSTRYQAPYRVEAFSPATVAALRQAQVPDLALAPGNAFIARAYPLSGKGGESAQPVRLENTRGLTIWYYPDQNFGSPKGIFDARITTPAVETCTGAAQTELYLALVRDELSEATYQAGLAGLGYSLHRWHGGVGLNIDGYTDRQEVLLEQVLEALIKPQWSERDFHRLRSALVRDFRNTRKQWPVRQLFQQMGPLLQGSCDELKLASELEATGFADLNKFPAGLFATGHIRFYGGGALTEHQVLRMAQLTQARLQVGKAGDVVSNEEIVALPRSTLQHSIDVEHSDSGVLLYIQGHNDSLLERALVATINGALEAPFYTTMRTEKQFGYVVGANIRHLNRVPGLAFYIQSPVAKEARLQSEINDFISAYGTELADMSDKELERIKAALLANIEERPRNIDEQAGRHQESLSLGYEGFDFREKLAEQVRGIDREALLSAYQRLLREDSRRLWVTTGRGTQSEAVLSHGQLKNSADKVYAYPR